MQKIFFVLLLLMSPAVLGATITGNVYDVDFEPLANVVVEINTTPAQKLVARDGSYGFNVPEGHYKLTASIAASHYLSQYATEEVVVQDDGEYIVDLFTFPELPPDEELEEILSEEPLSFQVQERQQERARDGYQWFFVLLMIAGLGLYVYSRHSGPRKHSKRTKEALPEDLKEIVQLLKTHGGRMNQKQLRKHIPLSEAKVSLMITDLENRGLVRKIKKGRGNVLVLQ